MKKIIISGGIFFALLSEIKISDSNISNRMSGKRSSCTNLDLIHALGAIIGDSYTTNQIVKKTASSYKTCEGQGGLGFNTIDCANCFNVGITNNYPELLKRTEKMLQKCIINEEKDREKLISKLIFFISNASNLDNVYFYYPSATNKMNAKEISSLKTYNFAPFILAVWEALIFNVNNNKVASATFKEYFELDHKRNEYFFKHKFESYLRTDFEVENLLSQSKEIRIDESEFRDSTHNQTQTINTDYYTTYISNCVNKISKLKTILYTEKPVDFYSIYVCNDICLDLDFKDRVKDSEIPLKSATPKKLIDRYGNFLTISAPGGSGKSMFLKHMMLCEYRFKGEKWMDSTGLVPVLLTLKDFNKKHDSIESFIFERMKKYDPNLDQSIIKKDFSKGIFMFLFDALDEVENNLLDEFITQLDDFSAQYDSNVYILSSRPNSICNSLTSFTALRLLIFSEREGEKLINNFTDFDKQKRDEFNKRTFTHPKLRYQSNNIEGNPLLLTIKFMIFMQTNKILESGSADFFDAAYEALYTTHDQIHNHFTNRVYKTKLEMDELKKAISEFCYLTYFQFKYTFRRSEIDEFIEEMKTAKEFNFNTSAFIRDLKDNLSLLVVEDGIYTFIHRNFQQYFAAFYLSRQKKSFFTNDIISLIDNYSAKRYQRDSILYEAKNGKGKLFYIFYDCEISTLLDMAHQIRPDKIEKFIFLPALKSIFGKKTDLQHYIHDIYGTISYGNGYTTNSDYNSPYSEIITFIISNILDKDPYHDLFSGPNIERLITTYYYLDNDNGIEIEDEVRTKWVNDEVGFVQIEPDGVSYELDPLDINENSNEYNILISYLQDNFEIEMNNLKKYYINLVIAYEN